MQKILLFLISLVSFILPSLSYAKPVTFDEVKQFFSHKVTAPDYMYPAESRLSVDIFPLWNRLGLDLQKGAKDRFTCIFGCMEKDKQCFLPGPELIYFSRKKIKIIDITKEFQWDHQYLIFKNGVYIGHAEYAVQKYEDPTLVFLEDNIFSIKYLDETGSGILGYRRDVYKIDDKNGIKKILNYRDQYEREGWGMPYDISINSKSFYNHDGLKVKYQIKVMQGFVQGVNEEASDEPFVKDYRTITYKRHGNGFMVDTKASNLKPDTLDKLDGNTKFLYLMYKSQFDRLIKGDKEDRQWYNYFLKFI